MKKGLRLVALVLISLIIGHSNIIENEGRNRSVQQIVQYASIPGAIPSPIYSMKVNGQPVPVEQYKDVHYARFSFNGTVEIIVHSEQPPDEWMEDARIVAKQTAGITFVP